MKILTQPFLLAFSLFLLGVSSHAQTPPPLSFYPYRAGNVWQYRDAFNNEIAYTRYNDRDSVGNDSSIYIWGRILPGSSRLFEKIDASYSVYALLNQPNYPHYKLNADSGQSWQAAQFANGSQIVATLIGISSGRVFGFQTTVRRYRFTLVYPPPHPPFWISDDYLASGFGLVQSFVEPGATFYLAGAIIDSVRWGIIVGVNEQTKPPHMFALHQNYPNPFNPTTTINYDVAQKTLIRLKVFDLLGRELATLVDDVKEAGPYSVSFQANGLASGVYFYRLEMAQTTLTKKMIIQK